MIFYLLQMAFQPVAVVGRLVQYKKRERNSYIQRETIYKTLQKQNTQNGKQNTIHSKKKYVKGKI
jgi:hypothetical protein